jgi:hypothetical protein
MDTPFREKDQLPVIINQKQFALKQDEAGCRHHVAKALTLFKIFYAVV